MTSFSVLVPAWNSASTLPRALESALRQVHAAREIIVCDDGSTDNTKDVLRRYGDAITVVRQSNAGLSQARNAALRHATSDYVALLDADDEWIPERLLRAHEAIAQDPSAVIVTTDALVSWGGQLSPATYYEAMMKARPLRWSDQCVEILRDNFIFGGAVIQSDALRRAGGFEVGLSHDSEYGTWIRMILEGGRAIWSDGTSVIYHRSTASLSGARLKTFRMILELLDRIVDEYPLESRQRQAVAEHRERVRVQMGPHLAVEATRVGSAQARAMWLRLATSRASGLDTTKRLGCLALGVAPHPVMSILERLGLMPPEA